MNGTIPRVLAPGYGNGGGAPRAMTTTSSRSDLVTVVVPAYNAAATIDETLLSVRAQTHRRLEILVVDDGSTDATPEIALRHAREDLRVRLIRQANAGVAAARNRGIEEARGELVAPVDADDLWRPEKIDWQVQTLRQRGPRVALVYTWYATIDEEGRVVSHYRPHEEGDVLARMCLGNLVGNGSSVLMRRSAVLEVGGYDPGLKASNAQGCEDYKLYLQIAERHHFALVRDSLTGYRVAMRSMSGDIMQMLRSFDLVVGQYRGLYPQHAEMFRKGRGYFLRWSLLRALRYGRYREAAALARLLAGHNPRFALGSLVRVPAALAKDAVAPPAKRVAKALLRPGRPRGPRPFLAASALAAE